MEGLKLPNLMDDWNKNMAHIDKVINYKPDGPMFHVWAEDQYMILKKYIQDFEDHLDPDHEVGFMFTNFGQAVTMQVTNVFFEEPVLMVFKGFIGEQEATLIQHVNQLNFLLTATEKKTDVPKRKIGFSVDKE